MLIIKCEKTREKRVRKEKKKIFGVLITQNPAAVFRRSPEFAPSDRHDFWTEASLHIKEGFDRWDFDFEAWKFCFLPGQIASCLVIFFLSCSLFVAIYLDIDSKIMMIVDMGIKFEDVIQGLLASLDEKESHKVPLHIQIRCLGHRKAVGEVKVEAPLTEYWIYCLKFDTGMELVLHNVKHVPDMRLNIISTGLLDEDGYHNSSECMEFSIKRTHQREHRIELAWQSGRMNLVGGESDGLLYCRVALLLFGVWSGKDVSYHHLRVFGCKASVHIPKDERSKLDVKNKPCVFLGYGQDELGYRLYDPVQKKLVRSRDVESCSQNILSAQFGDDLQNDEEKIDENEEHGADDVDAQEQPNLDEDVHPELPVPMPPFVPLRRSTRDHHPSTRYSANEYVLLTDGGEPECYAEAMEDEHKKEWFDARQSWKWDLFSLFLVWRLALDLEVSKWMSDRFLHGDMDIKKFLYGNKLKGFQVKGKEDYVVPKITKVEDITSGNYIEKVLLRRFNMDKAKVVSSPLTPNFKLTDKDCPSSKKNIEKMDRVPYASAVGSLMYAMVCTRPDLAHAVGVVSRFLSNPGKKHWEAVKWIFRYLRGTSKLGITFGNGKPMLVGYTDSDLAGNKDNMKSTSGYLMTFAGGAVSWQSRLQKCVALSTTEAEYVAATEACKELLWLKRFLQELGFKQQRYAVLCDNQSTIHLAKNSMFHKRTKHIDIRYHWIRDAIEDGMFELNKVHTDDNASDMLTKAVAREKLKICCSFAGMANSSS
ncbi:retrovirus-related pol polyprotein from transposon TNT 1-94 [Tanacetum coccineum]